MLTFYGIYDTIIMLIYIGFKPERSFIMKTKITAFISLLLSMMLLVSCSQPVQQQEEVDESAAAKAVVEQFADDVMTLDFDKMSDNLASSVDTSELEDLDVKALLKSSLGEAVPGEIDDDTVEAVLDIITDIAADKIKITVGEPKADGDDYAVPVTVSLPDFENAKEPSESEIMSLLTDSFGDTAIGDIMSIMSSSDSSDVLKFITSHKAEITALINGAIDICFDGVDNITDNGTVTVVKENGKWKISDFEGLEDLEGLENLK